MVMKMVTSASRLDPPKLNQVGPFMRQAKLYKHTLLTDLSTTAEKLAVESHGEGTLTLTYQSGSNRHQAGLSRSNSGTLICVYCTLENAVAWCPHLHHAVRNRLDRALYTGMGEGTITVPIIPSEGVFVPVRFEPTRKGWLRVIAPLSNLADDEPVDVEIGVASPGRFGTMEVRGMVTDMLMGRFTDAALFYQGVTDVKPIDKFTTAATKAESTLSEFSRMFYRGIWGKTFGEMEVTGTAQADAPTF